MKQKFVRLGLLDVLSGFALFSMWKIGAVEINRGRKKW